MADYQTDDRPMQLLASLVVMQALSQAVQVPVLEFPQPGLDDPAAYEGYATRFFRDSRGNTFQVYLNGSDGRVVHVWADAANESIAFTVRDEAGRPAPVIWGGPGAEAAADGPRRIMRHRLAADVDAVEIGLFALGTMRQERDVQGWGVHQRPFGDTHFVLREFSDLVAGVERLPPEERERHLGLLNAGDLAELRSRLEPRVTLSREGTSWIALVEHTSLDGRNHLTLEFRGDTSASSAALSDSRLSVRARDGGSVVLDVTVTTDADPLTALGRERLFNDAFEAYVATQQATADSLRRTLSATDAAQHPWLLSFRRFERQVRGLELLSSEEKLIASMPNYATYFGRDQMMSALMLEPISSVDVQELVIASVLRKVASSGNVSHEEALGGQAIRERAAEYAGLVNAWEEARVSDPAAAAEHLARARGLLGRPQAVRENYHMVDDDFQLPVLVDRYLSRSDVTPDRMRRFLTDPTGSGGSRLEALVRNLAFVAELARPYAAEPATTNLVSFFNRDDRGWLPGSWRDSRVGYGGGRFAMDVNVVWVPKGLEAVERILGAIDALGLSVDDAVAHAGVESPAFDDFRRNPAVLRAAVDTWRGARRHFEVRLEPETIRERVQRALAAAPALERGYWLERFREQSADLRPLAFLALSLDDGGQPIAAPNTDPATELFLESYTEGVLAGAMDPASVLEMLDALARPYPVGLLVERLGHVVVNDVYASAAVQQRFRDDLYHSPRVVWGREVNLLLLGLARQIAAAYDASGRLRDSSEAVRSYVHALRQTLETTRQAVEASGMKHNELWSYRVDGDTLRPVRYGTSSDIQLWNLTDLAVRFLLDRLPPQ